MVLTAACRSMSKFLERKPHFNPVSIFSTIYWNTAFARQQRHLKALVSRWTLSPFWQFLYSLLVDGSSIYPLSQIRNSDCPSLLILLTPNQSSNSLTFLHVTKFKILTLFIDSCSGNSISFCLIFLPLSSTIDMQNSVSQANIVF